MTEEYKKKQELNRAFLAAAKWIGLPDEMTWKMVRSQSDFEKSSLTKGVEKRKEELSAATEQSIRDPLTNDFNRVYFMARLEETLDHVKRDPTQERALLFIDLDKFKEVNDTYGHAAGDKILISVSEALKKMTRQGETVSRMGGDEFCVLIRKDPNDTLFPYKSAQRIYNCMRTTIIEHEGKQISVGSSIGVVEINETTLKQYKTAEAFRIKADRQMYDAKGAQGGVCVWDDSLQTPIEWSKKDERYYTTVSSNDAPHTLIKRSEEGDRYCTINTPANLPEIQ